MSRLLSITVFAVTAVFFLCFFVWPVAVSLEGAFFTISGSFTLSYVAEVWRNPIYLEGLKNSFLIAVDSTALAMLVALPLALLADRFIFPLKGLLSALLLVPMIMPPFVGAIGVRQILGQEGSLNALLEGLGLMNPDHPTDWLGEGRFWGVVVMNGLHLYPILYLNVAAALANLDPALEEAAENLGCTGIRRFFRITFPLIMPGLFAGGTIVFIWAFTDLGVPLMFEFYRVTPVQIFNGIQDISGNPFPYALVSVMLFATALLYLASKWLFGSGDHAMMAKATSQGGPKKAGVLMSAVCVTAFSVIIFLAFLPHLGVILVSVSNDWYGTVLPGGWTLHHYESALGNALTLPSIRNSLGYACLATLVDVILGVAVAYVVVRTKLAGRALLDAMAMLPLAVPGLVLAFGYLAMTQEGHLFAALNPIKNPVLILVIAYSIRRLPYVVRSAAAGFQQTSVTLEEAAQNLGCPPFRAMRRITLPLVAANLLAGALLAFSFAMLEVSDSLLLAQKQQFYPITKAIFELYQLLGSGPYIACALGVWAMAFLGLTMLGTSMILGKKMGAIFRV